MRYWLSLFWPCLLIAVVLILGVPIVVGYLRVPVEWTCC